PRFAGYPARRAAPDAGRVAATLHAPSTGADRARARAPAASAAVGPRRTTRAARGAAPDPDPPGSARTPWTPAGSGAERGDPAAAPARDAVPARGHPDPAARELAAAPAPGGVRAARSAAGARAGAEARGAGRHQHAGAAGVGAARRPARPRGIG